MKLGPPGEVLETLAAGRQLCAPADTVPWATCPEGLLVHAHDAFRIRRVFKPKQE